MPTNTNQEGPTAQQGLDLLYEVAGQMPGTRDAHARMTQARDLIAAAIEPGHAREFDLDQFPWEHEFPCGCQATTVEWDSVPPAEGSGGAVWHPRIVKSGNGHYYRVCPVHPDLRAVVDAAAAAHRETAPEAQTG